MYYSYILGHASHYFQLLSIVPMKRGNSVYSHSFFIYGLHKKKSSKIEKDYGFLYPFGRFPSERSSVILYDIIFSG